jgi:hypothetical protein
VTNSSVYFKIHGVPVEVNLEWPMLCS